MEDDTLGKYVYEQDKTIKNSLEKIINEEKDILHQYRVMNDYKDAFTDSPEFDSAINTELEKRKLYLLYKMQTKEQQHESLIKILDYLTFLDNKKKI